jgi:hypothetical protein
MSAIKKDTLIVGLDIGTTKICAIVGMLRKTADIVGIVPVRPVVCAKGGDQHRKHRGRDSQGHQRSGT